MAYAGISQSAWAHIWKNTIQSVVGLLLVRSQSHGALFSEAGKSLQRKEKLIATGL